MLLILHPSRGVSIASTERESAREQTHASLIELALAAEAEEAEAISSGL